MDESGNNHSQQTDTRTESQAPYVLTHRWVLNNENAWTLGEEHHTKRTVGGLWRDNGWWEGREGWGEITWAEMPDIVCT